MRRDETNPFVRSRGRCEQCGAASGSEVVFGAGGTWAVFAVGPDSHRRELERPDGRWSAPQRVELKIKGGLVLCQRCRARHGRENRSR